MKAHGYRLAPVFIMGGLGDEESLLSKPPFAALTPMRTAEGMSLSPNHFLQIFSDMNSIYVLMHVV